MCKCEVLRKRFEAQAGVAKEEYTNFNSAIGELMEGSVELFKALSEKLDGETIEVLYDRVLNGFAEIQLGVINALMRGTFAASDELKRVKNELHKI